MRLLDDLDASQLSINKKEGNCFLGMALAWAAWPRSERFSPCMYVVLIFAALHAIQNRTNAKVNKRYLLYCLLPPLHSAFSHIE